MLRDNLVGLIEPMRISAGVDPLALSIQKQASDDRSSCLENPRPNGAESSLTENVTSPFQAEPTQMGRRLAIRLYWMWRNGCEYSQSLEFGSYAGKLVTGHGAK
jgi:hypothetical protein